VECSAWLYANSTCGKYSSHIFKLLFKIPLHIVDNVGSTTSICPSVLGMIISCRKQHIFPQFIPQSVPKVTQEFCITIWSNSRKHTCKRIVLERKYQLYEQHHQFCDKEQSVPSKKKWSTTTKIICLLLCGRCQGKHHCSSGVTECGSLVARMDSRTQEKTSWFGLSEPYV
jgi:hypothetical protein